VWANTQVNTNGLDNAWSYPHGLTTPAAMVAMQATRYLHDHGATSEDFGRVAVADRRHAATNPNAFFYGRPITLEDHQASRMIVDPLHLLDCCRRATEGWRWSWCRPSGPATCPSRRPTSLRRHRGARPSSS
jgi:acetyl-CoA acetyltransferase